MKHLSSLICLLSFLLALPLMAIEPEEVKPVKNLILMVSDGTSFNTISLARWMQFYQDPSRPKLNIDPYLCGTVRTNCSDAPIGDSAPTTSCYVTGYPSRSGYVSTFPPDHGRDNIEPIDGSRAYAPIATLLEAAKQLQHKSTGLVVNCIFSHATPADCSAHYYNRQAYSLLAEQQVKNQVDVLIGGGNRYLTLEQEEWLRNKGYDVLRDDLSGLRSSDNLRLWALFGNEDKDYEVDRDTALQPDLAECTRIALSRLSQNPEGFFLMVEGSLVDYAAHNNDLPAVWREFLAFDKACGVALDFARQDGETAVVILSDHATGGLNIGSYNTPDYSRRTKDELFAPLLLQQTSAYRLSHLIAQAPRDSAAALFLQHEGITLTQDDIAKLNQTSEKDLEWVVTELLNKHTPYFSWATYGHTGEEVFLATYHPADTRPMGMQTNVEIAHYMQALFGLYGRMDQLTDSIFAPHTEVFRGMECTIAEDGPDRSFPTLHVLNPQNGVSLQIRAFGNEVVQTSGCVVQRLETASVMPYVDRTGCFYLPTSLRSLIE